MWLTLNSLSFCVFFHALIQFQNLAKLLNFLSFKMAGARVLLKENVVQANGQNKLINANEVAWFPKLTCCVACWVIACIPYRVLLFDMHSLLCAGKLSLELITHPLHVVLHILCLSQLSRCKFSDAYSCTIFCFLGGFCWHIIIIRLILKFSNEFLDEFLGF